jgi:hypothetical protein
MNHFWKTISNIKGGKFNTKIFEEIKNEINKILKLKLLMK